MAKSPRQGLNARQAETVEKLLAGGLAVLEEVGPEELTIRMVASHAGVSPATAYTYLASKNHLFAEVYLRHITDNPPPDLTGSREQRLHQMTGHFAETLFATRHLASAANIALLSHDPEVERLRLKTGGEIVRRFRLAVGEDADQAVVDALVFAFSGALLQAGMGLFEPRDLAARFDAVATAILKGHK